MRPLDRARLRVGQQHAVAGLRGHLRDSRAHRAGADDANDGFACQRLTHAHEPPKRGARFSMNAVTPSR